MLTLTVGKDKTIEFGKEITIETDGINVAISDGRTRIEKEYESPLELIYVMMWFMKACDKTKVVFKEGETEFVRKKEYNLRDEIRL